MYTFCEIGTFRMTTAFNCMTGTIFSFVRSSYSICYSDIGCFESNKPYDNALYHLPQSPSEIDVKFKLFTRRNPETYEILISDSTAINLTNYTRSSDTKFIIHGYQHSLSALWDIKMKNEILKRASLFSSLEQILGL
ncbi:hypothetical protein CHS0354_020438 [Potamilus streckersoni]|uniref:Lipase domain-containing protein n=1 Tax=Potamilus streckersoni TaxID=2493646 RepID=A0AAE0VXZ1_9BIVA|nr:hypothetical protein CHS0354_020438 [Potamilus streckersoni]